MDSEQLVSNPYQELQNEAIDSVKKVSFTEKLTSVKNNVCEHQFKSKARHLDRERQHKLRNLHIDSNNLRYEVKLMDIKRRRNNLEIQKRVEPEKDFSYDTRQISNTEKRLGIVSGETYYLDRKQKFPLRGNILRDHNAKPIIKIARRKMHNHTITKNKEQMKENEEREERANTAQTMSTAVNITSNPPSRQEPSRQEKYHNGRRGSKSAPPLAQGSNERSRSRASYIDEENEGKLPTIQSRVGTGNQNKSHVKFKVEDKTPFRQSTPQKVQRSKTYHPGMRLTRSSSEAFWDSDSDDDYSMSEKVDLRALFFGNKSQNGETRASLPSGISGLTTPRTLTRLSSTDVPISMRGQPARPSEEKIKQQNKKLRAKIDKFLGTIPRSDSEYDSEAEEKKILKEREKVKEKEKMKEKGKAKEEKEDTEKVEKPEPVSDAVSKAIAFMRIFAKPVDPHLQWGYVPPRNTSEEEAQEQIITQLNDLEQEQDKEKPAKKMWEFIKTEISNGNVKRKYSANALLLQQLTGILIESDKRHIIPTNAASRALRHTPTFKMRRVVEEMMRQRTRFEQQEIERLQKKEAYGEGGMYGTGGGNEEEEPVPTYPARAWATPTRQLELET